MCREDHLPAPVSGLLFSLAMKSDLPERPPESLLERYESGTNSWSQSNIGIASQGTLIGANYVVQQRPMVTMLYWLKVDDWLAEIDSTLLTGARFEMLIEKGNEILEKDAFETLYQQAGG